MTESIWPTTINGQKYNQPHKLNQKWIINDKPLIEALEHEPKLWNHMIKHKQNLNTNITQYMDNISYTFEQIIPNKSFGRIIVPETEWQEELEHQFIVVEFIHCANYDNHILPFHDEENQYCGYFFDIENSIKTNEIKYFFKRDEEPNGTDEEFLWTFAENIEIIYTHNPNNDDKDIQLGFKDILLSYMKGINNMRLDEIYESANQFLTILVHRLRGKMRNGIHGCYISVKGTGTDSIIDTLIEKMEEIVTADSKYSDKKDVKSFKLSRHLLFGALKIHPAYAIKIYNEYGKLLQVHRSLVKECELFKEKATGYKSSLSSLLSDAINKNKKKVVIPHQFSAFNGLRVTINIRNKSVNLTTNVFVSKVNGSTMDATKNKFPIKSTLGRKTGW